MQKSSGKLLAKIAGLDVRGNEKVHHLNPQNKYSKQVLLREFPAENHLYL